MPGSILDSRVYDLIAERHRRLLERGDLLSPDKLRECYGRFRERFGPEQLSELDGVALLETMHLHGEDNLVYWLEFKDDEEMPAVFGSIAGGSAFKFGLYYSEEAGSWVTGSPTNRRYLDEDAAVEIARSHRDQLLAGVELLYDLSEDADEDEYANLEREIQEKAPDVAYKSWGHKYFSLIFPEKLDDYHTSFYQRFILTKCLQVPPEGEGRYVCAARFMAMRRELDLPINHLMRTLNDLFGSPYTYWLLSMTKEELAKTGPSGEVALHWDKLGDLGGLTHDKGSKQHLRELMSEHYPAETQRAGAVQQVFDFCTKAEERDLVVVHDEGVAHAVGRLRGPYVYEASSDLPHRREVEWLSIEEWKLPPARVPSREFAYSKYSHLLIEIERRIFNREPISWLGNGPVPSSALSGIPGRISGVLKRKGQVILYGPPGTGKTYWAERTAKDLASYARYGQRCQELDQEQAHVVFGTPTSLVRQCTFHPAYGYEDFIEGYRPTTRDGQLVFELSLGIFRRLCEDAASQPDQNYYLIIDEINRGDIPRIFGELLTVLEMSKRGKPVTLPVTGDQFVVPRNVFVIGTMNTADRSIALLDTALRRRFGFIELMPDPSVLGSAAVAGIPLGPWLAALNSRLREHLGRDARNLQVGHSYLMRDGKALGSLSELRRAIHEDLIPLLQEYCYEDWQALRQILGSGLVDVSTQRVRDELFEDAREAELVQALVQPSPDISTSVEAAQAEAEDQEVEQGDGSEGSESGEETEFGASEG